MFETRKSRQSLENCPNRSVLTIIKSTGGKRLNIVCPKVPKGMEIEEETLISRYDRGALSVKLGCLACPYRHEEYTRLEDQRVTADGSVETSVAFLPKEAFELAKLEAVRQQGLSS